MKIWIRYRWLSNNTDITFCVITLCVRKVITICVERLLHSALKILLHFASMLLQFASILNTFCVNITFCGDYYILQRNTPGCDAVSWCAVYQQNKIFVSYLNADRVMVFNNAGEYLYYIGSEGSGDGQFSGPTRLAIEKFNRLIVCDAGNRRLQLFTLDGKYVAKVAGSFFYHNCHLLCCAVSNTGHLFATDCNKHCIYVFNY